MSVISSVFDLLYPRVCGGCGDMVKAGTGHICWDCLVSSKFIKEPFCKICGDPADGMIEHEYTCSWCLKRRPYFDMARSVVRHDGEIRHAVHLFKYGNAVYLRNDFAELLLACVNVHFSGINFDAVIFVPLYSMKERERTYNQSRLLAGNLALKLKLPVLSRNIVRIRHTRTQTNFSISKRLRNISGAFRAVDKAWLEGRSLLLVDDVITTGATVNECAKVLKRAGAWKVCVVSVARG